MVAYESPTLRPLPSLRSAGGCAVPGSIRARAVHGEDAAASCPRRSANRDTGAVIGLVGASRPLGGPCHAVRCYGRRIGAQQAPAD